MTYGESNGHVTDNVTWPRNVKSWPPLHLESNIAKNRKQLEMLFSNNRYMVCCEAARSAILATAWLLVVESVKPPHSCMMRVCVYINCRSWQMWRSAIKWSVINSCSSDDLLLI